MSSCGKLSLTCYSDIRNLLKLLSIPSEKPGQSTLNGQMLIHTHSPRSIQYVFTWFLLGDTILARYLKIMNEPALRIVIIAIDSGELDLDSWYTVIGRDPIARNYASNKELLMIKGLAHKTMCWMLDYINTQQQVNKITLDAMPSMGAAIYSEPIKLIKYYQNIGFSLNESMTDVKIRDYLETGTIHMSGSFNQIHTICSQMSKDNLTDFDHIEIIKQIK